MQLLTAVEMLPWAQTPAVHSFEKFPPEKEFPALAEFFANQKGLCSTKEIREQGKCP